MKELDDSILSKKEEIEIKNQEVFEDQNLAEQKTGMDQAQKEGQEVFEAGENLIVVAATLK